MDIEKAFNKLTGDTDNTDSGKIRGTTKKEVKELCGSDWDERAWKRMINASSRFKDAVNGELPFYDKKQKLWFWY
jgi:hypothetical protein